MAANTHISPPPHFSFLALTPTHYLKCACIMSHGEPLRFRGSAPLLREEAGAGNIGLMEDERIEDPDSRICAKTAPRDTGSGSGSPPCLHLARSFPGDSPCSSTSPRDQVQVRCELGREQLHPSPRHPTLLLPQELLPGPLGLTCGSQCGPEYQRLRGAQASRTPHPRGLGATLSQRLAP